MGLLGSYPTSLSHKPPGPSPTSWNAASASHLRAFTPAITLPSVFALCLLHAYSSTPSRLQLKCNLLRGASPDHHFFLIILYHSNLILGSYNYNILCYFQQWLTAPLHATQILFMFYAQHLALVPDAQQISVSKRTA